MGIVNEDVTSNNATDPVAVYGLALVTRGLSVGGAVDGFGLLTFGFLWQQFKIWFDRTFYESLSTSWSQTQTAITTSWTDTNAVITTSWTDTGSGAEGSYPP